MNKEGRRRVDVVGVGVEAVGRLSGLGSGGEGGERGEMRHPLLPRVVGGLRYNHF